MPDALPGSDAWATACWCSRPGCTTRLGNTLSQIVEVFNFHLQMKTHARRPGADVVSAAGDSLRLVRADSAAKPCDSAVLARRRKRLAGRRQNALAVVLHDARLDLST